MLAIDENGDFVDAGGGRLAKTKNQAWQNYMSECRCVQDTWPPQPDFGRSALVWTVSQSVRDRIADLKRIGDKYVVVQSVTYDDALGVYKIR